VPAVLTGDYLFATAFDLLARSKKAVLITVTGAIRSMCSGEIQQSIAGSPDPAAYFNYIGQKTAALISAACRCGGILSRLKLSQQNCLARFGWHLGLAYQLVDDYLDLFGSVEKIGKPGRQDLARGLFTLPILRLLMVCPDAPRWQERIKSGLTAAEIEALVSAARHWECDIYTARAATEEIALALEELDKLPFNPVQEELALLASRILTPLGESS
ncbi:MAG: polyprenyl synthetase family protein, partial [Moorella sp. (in: Bacteria)]|nr:polyprenyl synthetase family protein [Moorella sp. (in: firmicutes)]